MLTNQNRHWLYEYAPLFRWLFLFAAIAGTIYAATQTGNAALLALFMVGYIVCLNFSIPTIVGHITFAPILALISLFILGRDITLLTLISSIVLAELLFPIWRPLWHSAPLTTQTAASTVNRTLSRYRYTLSQTAVYLFTFIAISALVPIEPLHHTFALSEIDWYTIQPAIRATAPPLFLYIIFYPLGYLATQPVLHFSWHAYLDEAFPYLILSYFLLPFVLTSLLIYSRFPLIIFIGALFLFLLFNLLWWSAWQNNHTLRQQLEQLATLNQVAEQQRETLNRPAIIQRAQEQISAFIQFDLLTIVLYDPAQKGWERPLYLTEGRSQPADLALPPDDFTRWVQENGRPLDIDRSTLHYAQQHQLTPPNPLPHHWLGIPLKSNDVTLGAIVIQQNTPNQIIDRWQRELLAAIARQTSDGLNNAQRHGETIRLYAQTDEALTERVEQLQAVLNATSEAIALLDPQGAVILANPRAQQLIQGENKLGYTSDQWGKRSQEIGTAADKSTSKEIIQITLGENEEGWFERRIAAVNHDGQPLGWLVVLHDITELHERDQWRKQFTNMVVHDLRNPITTLLTNFDFMARDLAKNKNETANPITTQIETGRQVSHHMLDMVDSLLDAARLSAGQLVADAEAMHLQPHIEQVAQQMASQFARKDITFTLETTPHLPPIWADYELVRRVIVNLLDNAAKFTPSHGKITVTIALDETSTTKEYEPGLKCTIHDTGPGIPPKQRKEIFDQFVRITTGGAQTRGTGIGLSFCKQAIEIQNGRIRVDETAVGAQFTFTLPGIPHFDLDK